jgi:hypothetical protein
MNMNVYLQPRVAPTNAPNGTPATWATVIQAMTVARARPRYSLPQAGLRRQTRPRE